MTAIEKLLIKNTCLELMTAYCTHLDSRDEAAFLGLFTPDAVFVRLAEPVAEWPGHAGIRGLFNARAASILSYHMMLNHTVTIPDADTAHATALGQVVRGNRDRDTWPKPIRGLELLVDYQFSFRRVGDDWRITRCGVHKRLDIEVTTLAAQAPAAAGA